VQTDGGFVEDVETAHQAAAERGGEVDALTFAARERVAEAVEGEVAESHFSNDTSHIMINTIGEGGDYNQVQSYYMEFNTDGTFKKVE